MTHVDLRELAACQEGVVATWQLRAAGWSRRMIDRRLRGHGWQAVHAGVWALTYAPLTQRQRWRAATLTTPDSVLSGASAAACYGFRAFMGRFEVVTRPGDGGPRRFGDLLVCRSQLLEGDVTRLHGLPITTAARTVIDLAAHLSPADTAKAFREALRLRVTTIDLLAVALAHHPTARGTRLLRELAARYADVPYARTRSDAEARALEVLRNGGIPAPRVNWRIGGEEADLVWVDRRLIIEIDGPAFHQFRDEDERKARAWRSAGFTVRRLGSAAVFDRPDELLRLARAG
jgi:very-short-patch-repair endonuclease